MSFRLQPFSDTSDLEEEAIARVIRDLSRQHKASIVGPQEARIRIRSRRQRYSNEPSEELGCGCRTNPLCPLQQELERLRKHQHENDELKREIDRALSEISAVRTAKNGLQIQLGSAQDRLEELRHQLETQRADHQGQIRDLQTQLEQKMDAHRTEHTDQINNLQRNFDLKKEQQDQRLATQDRYLQDLKQRMDEIEIKNK
jgi:chromosome segregation ATPase